MKKNKVLQKGFLMFGAMCSLSVVASDDFQYLSKEEDSSAVKGGIEFDTDTIKGRGLNLGVADYFAKGSRFAKGAQLVTVYVNGNSVGSVMATFDDQGRLRLTSSFINDSRLKNPTPDNKKNDHDLVHSNFVKKYPASQIKLRPNKSEVWLIVPTDAVQESSELMSAYVSGGTAAIVNYNFISSDSQYANTNSSFKMLDTEVGFNLGDWLVRSRQNYIKQDDLSRSQHLYTYGQRTFSEKKATLQVGQINISNSIFSGDSILGFQVIPESALLQNSRSNAVVVEGVANSTARIEIRQSNALIQSVMVPAGPFLIKNLPLINYSSNLDVSVIESNGVRSSFIVPSSSFGGGTMGAAPGYSFAIGRYRELNGERTENGRYPTLATGTKTWSFNRATSISSGGMVAEGYQAIGWAADRSLTSDLSINVRQIISNFATDEVSGAQTSINLNAKVFDTVSFDIGATHQNVGYRELADTTYLDDQNLQRDDFDGGGYAERFYEYSSRYKTRYNNQYTSSIGWTDDFLGNFRVSHSYSQRFDNKKSQRIMGFWSKKINIATVSLTLEKSTGDLGVFDAGDTAYFSVSVPLGQESSLRSYINHDRRGNTVGSSYDQKVNDSFNYRVQAERNDVERESDLSISTNMLSRYTQTTLGLQRNGTESKSYNGGLIGAIVAHNEGITFSPYQVDDTLSILSVGKEKGVKLITPQGAVWTDRSGYAIAPSLRPYNNNRIEIEAKSLSRNVDISNGYKEINVGRGSVSRVEFDVVKTRRVLIAVSDLSGKHLLKGTGIYDNNGNYLTTVVDKGQVFLNNLQAGDVLNAMSDDKKLCKLKFNLPTIPVENGYFESIDAVCIPSK